MGPFNSFDVLAIEFGLSYQMEFLFLIYLKKKKKNLPRPFFFIYFFCPVLSSNESHNSIMSLEVLSQT